MDGWVNLMSEEIIPPYLLGKKVEEESGRID